MTKRMLIEDFAKTMKVTRKDFYAVMAENEHREERMLRNLEIKENEGFIQMEGNKLSFIVITRNRPTFVRFQDENNNIMEEYVVYGNSTQINGFTVSISMSSILFTISICYVSLRRFMVTGPRSQRCSSN